MAPPFPRKPTIGPLVRRSVFVAAIGLAGCSKPMRIGPTPPRIGPPPYDPTEDPVPAAAPDAAAETPSTPTGVLTDAGPEAPPTDASPSAQSPAPDAAVAPKVPVRIRIGPPVRDDLRRKQPIRIGARKEPRSTAIEVRLLTPSGAPLASHPVRIALFSGERIVTTDSQGVVVIDGVIAGDHPAVIRADGFTPLEVALTASRDSGEPTAVNLPE